MRGGVSEYLFGLVSALPPGTVEVLKLEQRERTLGWIPDFFSIRESIARSGVGGLIVSHVLPLGYVAWLLKLFRKSPYVVIVHGTDLLMAGRSSWKRFWTRRILRSASLVVANSEFTRRIAAGFGVQETRSVVVYPCPAVGSASKDMMRKGDGKRLLSACRLVHRKGVDRLIAIMPRLAQAIPGVTLVVVGSGPEEDTLKAMVESLGLSKRVRFVGAVPRSVLNELYDEADVFVLPGRPSKKGEIEGFGIALIEAALHGLPVVTGRIGGVPEAVEEGVTGLLTDVNSDEALLAAIKRLLAEPETRRSMGDAGRARALAVFTWPKQSAKLASLLETL